jgi:GcrA cell cycle regulator
MRQAVRVGMVRQPDVQGLSRESGAWGVSVAAGDGGMSFDWTADVITRLRDLWDEGHSTAEIGRRIGVSKCAVIGKSHRLDLPPRPSPIIRAGEKRAPRPRIHRPHRAVSTLPALASAPRVTLPVHQLASLGRRPPLPAPVQETQSVEQLRLRLVNAGPCQFPIWKHGEKPPRDLKKRFCGKPVAQVGGPYCDACHRITHAGRVWLADADEPAFVMVAGRKVLTDEGKRRIVEGQKRAAVRRAA